MQIHKINLVALFFLLAGNIFAFDYQIEGNIRGLKNDSVILFIRSVDKTGKVKSDTIITIAINDRFSIKGKSTDSHGVHASLGGFKSRTNFTFFIEKGLILITGDINFVDKISVTGTPSNDDYTARKEFEGNIYDRIRLLNKALKDAPGKDESAKYLNEIDALRDSINTTRIAFIKTHPKSHASAIYLYVLQDHISVSELEKLYNGFDPQVKNSSVVVNLPEKIIARKRSEIGKPAPEFTMSDVNGRNVSLSTYKGKYVLLEFWASWCVPCRAQNPALVKAYEKYKDKGFEIIGVSLDHIGDKWKEAIKKDDLTWVHISDLNAFENKVSRLYGVQPIPDNFLIDPKGIIIARRLDGSEVEKKLDELIGQ